MISADDARALLELPDEGSLDEQVIRGLAETVIAQAEQLERVRALFAGGPDTSCRTTWPDEGAGPIECVEVPMADLRAALGGAS